MRTMTPIFKDDCLALMGITVWKERGFLSPLSSKKTSFITLELLHDVAEASYLVLVGEQGSGQALDLAHKTVLKNILKAISWPLKECAWAEWVSQEIEMISLEEQLQMLNIQKVLILGNCPAVDFRRPTIQIPSIQEIVRSPEAKRKAWELLK